MSEERKLATAKDLKSQGAPVGVPVACQVLRPRSLDLKGLRCYFFCLGFSITGPRNLIPYYWSSVLGFMLLFLSHCSNNAPRSEAPVPDDLLSSDSVHMFDLI